MGEREEILSQLYRILDKNTNDVRVYYRLAEKCKRTFLKNFFKKLSHQKRIFCRRIRYEIRELEKEIALIREYGYEPSKIPKQEASHGLPSFKADMKGLIKYSHRREQEYLHLYKTLLSNTHLGNIREMLLNQRHAVQLTLNEIQTLEHKINYEKNGGEVSYS